MIRNTDTSDTDGKTRNDRNDKNDVTVPNEKFLFREAVVLISIVCLSLLNSVAMHLQIRNLSDMPSQIFNLYSLSVSGFPMIGVIFAAFLSEIVGRKPIFIYLFVLSVLTSIVQASSKHTTAMFFTIIFRGILQGGTSVMSALSISEYSTPKHRFSWLIVTAAMFNMVTHMIPAFVLLTKVIFDVLPIIQIGVGLACLGSTWFWPESPYWLASKGKLEESRAAFMWLRGKEGRKELVSVLNSRRRPGPLKLFWASLFICIATISLSDFSVLQATYFYMLDHRSNQSSESRSLIILCSNISAITVIAVVSYFIKRRLLFIVVSGVSFILSYAVALWMYLESERHFESIFFYVVLIASDVVHHCGPLAFGVILSIEIAPHKYNTFIACVCFIVMYVSPSLLYLLQFYLANELSFHPSVLSALYTTFSLIAALLYYFFAPETKDKTLIEIQRTYTSDNNEINDLNPEQNQSIMLNAI